LIALHFRQQKYILVFLESIIENNLGHPQIFKDNLSKINKELSHKQGFGELFQINLYAGNYQISCGKGESALPFYLENERQIRDQK
jgi:hypothetical protein